MSLGVSPSSVFAEHWSPPTEQACSESWLSKGRNRSVIDGISVFAPRYDGWRAAAVKATGIPPHLLARRSAVRTPSDSGFAVVDRS